VYHDSPLTHSLSLSLSQEKRREEREKKLRIEDHGTMSLIGSNINYLFFFFSFH
jgi:hypothetical protein